MEYINYNSSFEDVISKDIELLWAVQDYVHSNPKYKRWLHKIINKNPLQDICALVYIFLNSFIILLFSYNLPNTLHLYLIHTYGSKPKVMV